MRIVLILSMILLIASTDSPLQTSTVFSRDHFSLWIGRTSGIGWGDTLLVTAILLTLPKLVAAARTREFRYFFGILSLYLIIGAVQNIYVGGYLKVYLYDVKVALCFLVGWLGGREIAASKSVEKSVLFYIVLPYLIGAVADYILTITRNSYEYPALFFKGPHSLLPLEVLVVGIFYPKTKRGNLAFGSLLLAECLFAINRLSFGYLLVVFYSLILVAMLRIKRFTALFSLMTAVLFMSLSYYGFLEYFANKDQFSKADGVATRLAQIDNILADGWSGVPLIFGKGLGSPWHVLTPVPQDLYSTGTAISADPEKSATSKYQFVLNSHLASLLHKWGIVGAILVILFCAYLIKSTRRLSKYGDECQKQLEYYSVVTAIFLVNALLYYGLLRYSIVVGAFLGLYFGMKQDVIRRIRISSQGEKLE